MLDPFIDPSISVMKDTIAFGGVSAMYLEKQARACDIALNIIRTAAKSPAVLPSLELEWRRGAVAPRSVKQYVFTDLTYIFTILSNNLLRLMRTEILVSLFNVFTPSDHEVMSPWKHVVKLLYLL